MKIVYKINVIYTKYKEPIEQKISLHSEKFKIEGGGRNDIYVILQYLKNILFVESTFSEDIHEIINNNKEYKGPKNYIYKIITNNKEEEDSYYVKNKFCDEYNSYYLSNGLRSVVVLVKCIRGLNKFLNNVLVLKFNLFKNDEQKIEKWNKNFLIIYKIFKEKYNYLVGDIYFYGNDITNNAISKDEKNNIFECDNPKYNLTIGFTITKYFSQKFNEINISVLTNMIKKLFAVMTYINSTHHYVADFKIANVGFDKEYNWVMIDFDFGLFAKFYDEVINKYAYFYPLNLPPYLPCCMANKIWNNCVKNNLDYITKKNKNKKINKTWNENIKIDNKITNYLDKNIKIEYDNKVDLGMRFYSDINLYYDKVNSSSLSIILIDLFFEKIYYKNNNKSKEYIKGDMRNFYKNEKIFVKNKDGEYISLNTLKDTTIKYDGQSKLSLIMNRHICNEEVIEKLLYNFLKPAKSEYESYCEFIKKIIFDKESKTGLMASDYDNIPSYYMVFEYLSSYNNKKETEDILYKNCLDLIKENLKMQNIKMKNYFADESYFDWIQLKKNQNTVKNMTKNSYTTKFIYL